MWLDFINSFTIPMTVFFFVSPSPGCSINTIAVFKTNLMSFKAVKVSSNLITPFFLVGIFDRNVILNLNFLNGTFSRNCHYGLDPQSCSL